MIYEHLYNIYLPFIYFVWPCEHLILLVLGSKSKANVIENEGFRNLSNLSFNDAQ